jgi:hypothetical protein
MTEQRQTVAGAYAEIAAHERECAIRYLGIQQTMDRVEGLIQWVLKGVIAVLLAVVSWALVQLWNGRGGVVAQPLPVAEGKR